VSTTTLSVMTLGEFISDVGGFFSLIVMIVDYALFKYQFFAYETALMKDILHHEKDDLEPD
jgi:hypothetical protein